MLNKYCLVLTTLILIACNSENSISTADNRGRQTSVTPATTSVKSTNCFYGWVSKSDDDSPTGYCDNKVESSLPNPYVWSSIEVDYPTRAVYIHGRYKYETESGTTQYWLSRYLTTRCEDIGNGITVVEGRNAAGEPFSLTYTDDGIPGPLENGKAELRYERQGIVVTESLTCPW